MPYVLKNNLLLFLEVVVFPNVSLMIARDMSGLVGVAILVFGLVWDSD